MKTAKTEKLKLNRETLRALTDAELRDVAGGLRYVSDVGSGCSEGGGNLCTQTCPAKPSVFC
jgi:hypothetical protein